MSGTRDYIHLHFIVFLWGFTAVLGKLISSPPVELVLQRTFFSALGLVLIIAMARRTFRIHGGRNLLLVLIAGLMIAAHWILFFLAARLANVSVCLSAMATTAIWTSLLEPISLGKRIKPYELLLGVVAFLGILVIFQGDFEYGFGFLIAVLAAVLSAVFSVINVHVIRTNDPYTISLYELGFAALSIAGFLPFYVNLTDEGQLHLIPQGMDWVYLLVLVTVCTIYAFTASVELMRRLSAFTINLIINLEPVYGIILALLVFGAAEQMSGTFYLGTVIILLSVLIYPPLKKYFESRKPQVDPS